MHTSLSSQASKKRPSVVRVIVHTKNGKTCVGTGFYIASDLVLTCAHVLLDTGNIPALLTDIHSPKDPEKALAAYFKKAIQEVEVEQAGGEHVKVRDISFLGSQDVALLKVRNDLTAVLLQAGKPAVLGEGIFFCGYQQAIQTKKEQNPYTVIQGHVTSFLKAQVGGFKKHPLMQLQAMMLGGASGSPVFSQEDGRLVGLLHGYMHWGADYVCTLKDGDGAKPMVEPLHVPIPIAFATPIRDVMKAVGTLRL